MTRPTAEICKDLRGLMGGLGLRAEAADALERLENGNAHLQFCLNSRDEFLGKTGQWQAYVDTLPEQTAGVAGGWLPKAELERLKRALTEISELGDVRADEAATIARAALGDKP